MRTYDTWEQVAVWEHKRLCFTLPPFRKQQKIEHKDNWETKKLDESIRTYDTWEQVAVWEHEVCFISLHKDMKNPLYV